MRKRLTVLLAGLLLLCGCSAEKTMPEPTQQTQPPVVQSRETAHIHSYQISVVERTCTEDGYTAYTCACGDKQIGSVQPGEGHRYQDTVFEPTIAAEGYTSHTCEVCGHSYEDNVVAMLPDGIEDGSFFNDAVFVGDSIISMVQVHAMQTGCFGDAVFLFRYGYAMRFVMDHSMKMFYRGRELTIPEALAASGANKVFIQLGINDIASEYIDNNVMYWEYLIAEIREKCPDILIFIHTGTPIYEEVGLFNNENMSYYNSLLEEIAEDNDCFLVDTAAPLTDENGFLIEEYCSDSYCHLSFEGCAVWERALKDYLLEHKGEFA